MKILKLMLIACAVGFPVNSDASDIIVGSITCREWIADRTTHSDYINKNIDQSWVIGFLSAYSSVTGDNFLVDVKAPAIYKWMDKFCASHPLAKIDDGALILAHELTRQMKK